MPTVRLLIIEDYATTRDALRQGLEEEGFVIDVAKDAAEGLWLAAANPYHAIILDRMLPDHDGMHVLRELRSRNDNTHVLMLTAKDAPRDRVDGLNGGADDYLSKPFDFAELVARIHALIRRSDHRKDPTLRCADLEIDTLTHRVMRQGRRIDLTPREYSILILLARRDGEVVTRDELLEGLYDFDASATPNVIEVYIGYLRKKLEGSGLPRIIHTRRGHGYVLGLEP